MYAAIVEFRAGFGGRYDMRQRWDAEQQRWVDDDGGAVGAQPPAGEQPPERPWWAGAETQVGGVWPPSTAPEAPTTPSASLPPVPTTPLAPLPPAPAGPSAYGTPAPGPVPPYPEPPTAVTGPLPVTGPMTGPVNGPLTGPGPDPRRPRTVLVLVAVLAVLAGGGAGAGAWWLTRDGSAQHPEARPSVTVTATASRPAVPPADTGDAPSSPSDTESALAASARPSPGYRRAEDPVGYRVDVPEGWVRRAERGVSAEVVTYRSPADGRSLMLFEVVEQTPAASLDLAENGPAGFTEKLAGYRVLDRSSGADWAELDYRYDDRSTGATQVIDRRFTAADGTLYALRSSGPEGADIQEPFDMAFASFCPTGASCPAA